MTEMDIGIIYSKFRETATISTDTRRITPGSMFFALKGDKFNANEFAAEALEKGARYAVIDEEKYRKDDRCILVSDVLTALQALARHHRTQLDIPVIGLTGSNGKTTTKELMHAVLSTRYRTLATKGNLNNHIGVPLTILSIGGDVEVAVVEMGANHVGEIALLCSIANPTHGLITNIGKAHIGTFGGFDNIVRGKSELFNHLAAGNGVAFINSGQKILAAMAGRFRNPVFYPGAGDYYHAELVSSDPVVCVRAENGEEVRTNITGSYNFENIAAALCVGKFFNVDPRQANRAVAEYVPGNMRSQIVRKGGNTIILDAYNANPSSMKAAIENLSAMNTPKKVAILGDMFELGEESHAEHREIGRLLKEKGIRDVYLCGTFFKSALHEIPHAKYFEKKEDLALELQQFPVANATILVKASRGIGLETIVDHL